MSKAFTSIHDYIELRGKVLDDSDLLMAIDSDDFFQCPADATHIEHSSVIDDILCIDSMKIEIELVEKALVHTNTQNIEFLGRGLHDGVQTWVGLDPQVLQTPYHELWEMGQYLDRDQINSVIDLGAGYGRSAIVWDSILDLSRYIGHEFVEERVSEGQIALNRFCQSDCELTQQDITANSFDLHRADLYFIYDFGNIEDINQILEELGAVHDQFKLIARGDGVRSLIHHKHPWLDIFDTIHEKNYSIYSTYSSTT